MIHSFIELYKYWHKILPHLPVTSRHSLGARIDILFIETSELLFSASFLDGKKRLEKVEAASTKFDSAKFLLQLLWEIDILETKRFAIISKHTESVGKQLGGWLKRLRNEKLPA